MEEHLGLLSLLILLCPLVAAVIVAALGAKILRSQSHWPIWLGAAGSAICSILLASVVWTGTHKPGAPEVWRLGSTHTESKAEAKHTAEAGGTSQGQETRPAQFPPNFTAHLPTFAEEVVVYHWLDTGLRDPRTHQPTDSSFFDFGFYIDPLTVVMLLTVTIVALPIFIYSKGYMAGEAGYWRFFCYLGLFLFSMCTLVLGGNLIVLYMGWELVGLCSYLLIGYYYHKPAARAAAVKAFVVNRIGDFGFLLGILLLWYHTGEVDYQAILTPASAARLSEAGVLTPICLLLFCGAVGKSAQFPLYVWLLDAMEGPSPVSALIHAATMVTAGVYMVARFGVLFAYPYDTLSTPLMVVTVVGCFSALFAAICACAQYDMKKILAFSTMSQLGYMFVALGCGAPESAIFHLHTHAFFKALLFLGAGAVMHAMGGIIDMRHFGGLRRQLPLVWITFVIGGLALGGFPLLAGFWSKDEIVLAAFGQSNLLGGIMLFINVLTAFYTFRMVAWAFHGPEKLPAEIIHDGHAHVHKPGLAMSGSLVFLALGAVFVGYSGVTFGHHGFLGFMMPGAETIGGFAGEGHPALFHGFLQTAVLMTSDLTGVVQRMPWLMYGSAVLAIVGVVVGFALYAGDKRLPALVPQRFPGLYRWVANKFFIDEFNDKVFVGGVHKLGEAGDAFDDKAIMGAVYGVGAVPKGLGFVLGAFQRGRLQGYALAMIVGLVIIVAVTTGLWTAPKAEQARADAPAASVALAAPAAPTK